MKSIALSLMLLAAAVPSLAAETCPDTPKDKALRAEEVQARLQSKGYDVRRVKREGSCFEVKASKDGKRVELYVSPADASIVREKKS